tara:strand:- start:97027 stop:97899 length:873 start_codon:yes stop_codon:yes gene_type:complete
MQTIPTLTIIGGGKLGQTLGRLFHQSGLVKIGDVLNRSVASSQQAIEFIGAGRAIDRYEDLQKADIILIAVPDDQIVASATALANSHALSSNSVVFHCSGALPASVMRTHEMSAASSTIAFASIHPVRSFAQPARVAKTFDGTYCGVEGDQRALETLSPLFNAIGAHFVLIKAEAKTLYHAAAVFASNYLVTLLDTAVQTYAQASIPEDQALKMMTHLVRETSENVLMVGAEQALTGPIARGDLATVRKQYFAVRAWDHRYAAIYRQLGGLTARLARRKNRRTNRDTDEK